MKSCIEIQITFFFQRPRRPPLPFPQAVAPQTNPRPRPNSQVRGGHLGTPAPALPRPTGGGGGGVSKNPFMQFGGFPSRAPPPPPPSPRPPSPAVTLHQVRRRLPICTFLFLIIPLLQITKTLINTRPTTTQPEFVRGVRQSPPISTSTTRPPVPTPPSPPPPRSPVAPLSVEGLRARYETNSATFQLPGKIFFSKKEKGKYIVFPAEKYV